MDDLLRAIFDRTAHSFPWRLGHVVSHGCCGARTEAESEGVGAGSRIMIGKLVQTPGLGKECLVVK